VNDNAMTLQTRCVWCDGEHHESDVVAISAGERECGGCYKLSAPMTYAQYRMCRWAAFDRSGRTASPCVACGHRPDSLEELLQHLRDKHPFDGEPPP
jgi:hypothetical protein